MYLPKINLDDFKNCPFCGSKLGLEIKQDYLLAAGCHSEQLPLQYSLECHYRLCDYKSAKFYSLAELLRWWNYRPEEKVK